MAAPRRVRHSLSALVSHMWMRMPGQSWFGAAASYLAMWVAMTAAMMLPSLVPTLRRYRRAIRRAGAQRVDRLTALVTTGYFVVWTVVGMLVYPVGVALAEIQMRQPALACVAPVLVAVVVAIAGAVQLSAWKGRRLARCREAFARDGAAPCSAEAAWRDGLCLGVDCAYSCAGAMAILLVVGVMDLRAMAAVTVAITLERVAPARARVEHISGVAAVTAGLVLVARAVALR